MKTFFLVVVGEHSEVFWFSHICTGNLMPRLVIFVMQLFSVHRGSQPILTVLILLFYHNILLTQVVGILNLYLAPDN